MESIPIIFLWVSIICQSILIDKLENRIFKLELELYSNKKKSWKK